MKLWIGTSSQMIATIREVCKLCCCCCCCCWWWWWWRWLWVGVGCVGVGGCGGGVGRWVVVVVCVCWWVGVGGGSLSTNRHVIQLKFLSMNAGLVWNTVLLKRSSKGYFLERFLVKTYSHPPKYVFHHPLNPVCPNPQRTSCGRCSWNRPVETPSYGCFVVKDSKIHVLDTLARQHQWSFSLISSWLFHDMKTLFRITGIWWEESTTH